MTDDEHIRRYPHQFPISMVSSATGAEVPTNIAAVQAHCMQTMQRTRETWRFSDGPPPSSMVGMEVIE